MKPNFLVSTLFAITVLVLALPTTAATDASLSGHATTATADRTIKIGPETTYVNVQGGQIVRFQVGDKTFMWKFDTIDTFESFDLNRIAPPGLLDHTVRVYVSPDPNLAGR